MTKIDTQKNFLQVSFYMPIVISIICLVGAVFLLVSRFTHIHHKHFPIPRQTDVTRIQEWMTLPYIERVYAIPKPVLLEKLQLKETDKYNISIKTLAKDKKTDTTHVIQELQQTITQFQSTHTMPPTPK